MRSLYVIQRLWRPVDNQIFALAVPAFAALIAEPLFLLADTAIIGHLGTTHLAGLGAASTLLATAVGLCIFLAYGTTAIVGRRIGAGHTAQALAQGIDGIWLALGLGTAVAGLFIARSHWFLQLLHTPAEAIAPATTYLNISCLGLPAMLVVLAATGVLRGFQDTKTPLVVAASGASANIVANYLLVYPAGLGIAGSAWGTVICQWAMAIAFIVVINRSCAAHNVSWLPNITGMLIAARTGVPLVVRTLALRAALVATTMVAASQGNTNLAAHHISFTIWTCLVFALDALAIAGQSITSKALGAHDLTTLTAVVRRMVAWGTVGGGALGLGLVAISTPLAAAFNPDPAVSRTAAYALIVIGFTQAINGYVFVIDGILIGAGDGRYLAWASVVVTATYLPVTAAVAFFAPHGASGVVWLWVGFSAGFMVFRAISLAARIRGTAWIHTGSTLPK